MIIFLIQYKRCIYLIILIQKFKGFFANLFTNERFYIYVYNLKFIFIFDNGYTAISFICDNKHEKKTIHKYIIFRKSTGYLLNYRFVKLKQSHLK